MDHGIAQTLDRDHADPAPRSVGSSVLPFGITIFVSAFLLFQVQLIVGKYLLPWFGGTAAVWTTSLLFFQTLLFAGYCYAHWLVTRNAAGRQAWIHGTLLLSSLALLAWLGHEWRAPILAGESWRASVWADPAWQVLRILLISAGVPFFVLSATGPLLQAWFHRLEPDRLPYRLYALSNLGSALGLLAYPFLEEPLLRLTTQAWLWAGGFFVFGLFCALATWLSRRAPLSLSPPAVNDGRRHALPSVRLRVSWLAIAACASLLMVATTSTICRDVAPLPLLWVAPLFLYLLTFVVCFQRDTWYRRPIFAPLLVVATALACYALARDVRITGVQEIGIYCLALFAGCMVCHGELARLKPSPRNLTTFFLLLSAGGALGGLCAAVVAPRIFAETWEYHVALWGSCAVLVLSAGSTLRRPVLRAGAYGALVFLAATLVVTVVLRERGTIEITRNFYGVLRVAWDRDYPNAHILELYDGNIVHGAQFADPESRNSPEFYGTESGIGVAILQHPRYRGAPGGLRIGVVGLGAGAMAVFARPGDTVRFYEINPDVVRLARSHFTYLSDSPATVEVVRGDARISLEEELRRGSPQQFDVLALDAFQSDAVPMHLLTREAFRTYLQHLRGPESVLAVNVTGFNLDLTPVVLRLANEFGMCASLHENSGGGGIYLTDWMLLTRDPQLAARLAKEGGQAAPIRPGPLWTDETSNLLGVIRWRQGKD
ncbi:MAG TPA: fused MFS/spermidine synthase [Candidatus Angelobacter sp.]|nr:fused MFS/spermidine synthase [Candidatus Angelobacter sp.]